jgi:flagellar export protein FliJ
VAFRFSLASVLRLRESIERREELALQRAEHDIARAIRLIEELTDQLAKAGDARDEALQRSTPAYRLQDMQGELNRAVAVKQTLLDKLQTLKQQRDAQLRLYQAAYNGRQMLTELRQKKKDEYEQEQVRAQQKRLDDIFVARRQRG